MYTNVKGRDLRVGHKLKHGGASIINISKSDKLISVENAHRVANAIDVGLDNGTTLHVHPAEDVEVVR